MPHDHEADRELIQQALSREWGEPACALRIREFSPKFHVPGRRSNGSPSSQHRVRYFLWRVVKRVYSIALLTIEIAGNTRTGLEVRDGANSEVFGPEGSSAVRFVEALDRGGFWLVCGASHLAAARTASSPPVTVLWSAVGSERPQLVEMNVLSEELQWPDGSSVWFLLDAEERQRLVAM